MSEGLKNNLTSQTPANDEKLSLAVGELQNDTSAKVIARIEAPGVVTEIMSILGLKDLNPGDMVKGIGKLRNEQAANDEAFILEHKKAAYK